ncbi:MAG: glucoamylase family protein [Verrucomicrobiota bacterium]
MNSFAGSFPSYQNPHGGTKYTLLTYPPLALAVSLMLAAGPAQAQNLLVNPGFESPPSGQVVASGWTYFAPPTLPAGTKDYWVVTEASANGGVPPHSGTYYWKEWGALYNSAVSNVAGIYQTFSSTPGSNYQASGWFATSASDKLGAHCYTWLQVEFLDASSNLLALYKSGNFSASVGTSTWFQYQVTNACDLTQPVATGDPYFTTYAVTGSVNQLVAPLGTAAVRYRYCYFQAGSEGGSAYFDDAALGQASASTNTSAAPTNVVIFSGDQSVILHWDPDASPNVAGYNVYRSLSSAGPFTVQNTSLLTALGFCDLSVSDGQTYYYEVTAVDTSGNESLPSATVSTMPNPFPSDDAFLDYVQQANFDYFWYTANPTNGLVPDRTSIGLGCSISAVGFGLTAIGIAIDHGWITRDQGAARVLTTLNTFWNGPQGPGTSGVIGYNGWFYHFLDMNTATRSGSSELSSIDTTLLLGGILYVKQYFNGTNATETSIQTMASAIFNRVNWTWMAQGTSKVAMGWLPTTGFSTFGNWIGYDEGMILYLLGLGTATNPLPASSWSYWTSGYTWATYYGESYVPFPPLFGHEYSHCWVDFRHIGDAYMNSRSSTYFENSRRAALAQQSYCIANPNGEVGYSSSVWGLTACDDPYVGYEAHGAPPALNDDGTIAPTAPGGAMAFAPDISLPTLEYLYSNYRTQLWTAYGFRDAFNIGDSWYDTDELGIDQGPIVIMIENYRTQRPWRLFMQNAEIQRGLQRAGFVSLPFVALTAQAQPAQSTLTLTWAASAGTTYQVEYSTNLVSWFTSPAGEITATGPTASWTDSGPPGTLFVPFTDTERFYRVFQLGSP